ncbi:MAG: aminotransferase class V-fold PLP-dependent enzyme [Halodesulfurarchaeum sp.]
MNPSELRQSMPGIRDVVYLNTGASGPSPTPVVESIEETLETHEYESPGGAGMYENATDVIESTRESVGDFVGADPDSIALTESTTDGINRVATALDWGPDDTVVISDLEHAAGHLPWKRLRRTVGIDLEIVESNDGRFDLEAYEEALTDATLLCVSSTDWLYGRKHRIPELVRIANELGARTLVDAVQDVGQRPLDVGDLGADFVAAAGHKWLLGPWGAGFLYVDDSILSDVEPAHVGYRSVNDPESDPFEWKDGARRFEIGTTNPAVYAGLEAAIDTMKSIGLTRIRDRIESLTDTFKEGVPTDHLLSSRDFHSGLITVSVSDPESTVERLRDENIVVRSLPMSNAVRVSLHAFNTVEDVEAVLDGLQSDWE